jgi:hypothetical protein
LKPLTCLIVISLIGGSPVHEHSFSSGVKAGGRNRS